nr:hypothetical protein [Salidesulfovibrio brasiliensis]
MLRSINASQPHVSLDGFTVKAYAAFPHNERAKTLLHVSSAHQAFRAVQHLCHVFYPQHIGHQKTTILFLVNRPAYNVRKRKF